MYKKRKILAVIPARGGSKGIRHKNIRKINGIPLIGYTLKILKDISMIDFCIVSTDSKKIAKISEGYGFNVPFFRPRKLSGDLVADIDVLKSTLLDSENLNKIQYDIIIMLQPTSPMRKKEDIEKAIKKLVNDNLDSVWSLSLSDKKNHPLKQLVINKNSFSYYKKGGEKIIARQQLKNLYQRNGIIYALTRDCIIREKKLMGKKTGYILINRTLVNIDNELDIKFAEFLLKNNK